jgi:hypothetical protein
MKMTSLLTRKATCVSPLLYLEYEVVRNGTAIDKVFKPETDFEYYCNTLVLL